MKGATVLAGWTEKQLHELVMDLRQADWVNPADQETIHQKFFNILKPWFDAHNAQEWTPQFVRELREKTKSVSMLDWDEAISAAHNAALTSHPQEKK